jgi:hypothetical protein
MAYKIVKDLKIGDRYYWSHNNGIEFEVISQLTHSDKCIRSGNSRNYSQESYDAIKDLDNFIDDDNRKCYLNHSDVIVEYKERLHNRIKGRLENIVKLTTEIDEIRLELNKY